MKAQGKLGGLATAKECLWDGGRRGCQEVWVYCLGSWILLIRSSDREKRKMEARPLSTDILPETRLLKISHKQRKMIKFYVQGVDVISLCWRLLVHMINYLCVCVLNLKQFCLLNMTSNNRKYSSVFPEKISILHIYF